MSSAVVVTSVEFAPAPEALKLSGLLGWAACEVDGRWRLGGIAVRRTRADARTVVSFPTHRDRRGQEWPYVCPLTPEIRAAVERAILAHVGSSVGGGAA